MNTKQIEKFSNIVREKLLAEISGRAAFFGILPHTNHPVDQEYADSIVINGRVFDRKIKKQRERLVKKIHDKGFEQVIDEITYTWFNRFIALKFMEVNGYLPVRVFSSKSQDKTEPDLLTEALNLDFLKIDKALVFALKDENKDEELYKYLILELCHYLHTIMPFLFEKIGDHTELLFPERLLHTDSIIHDLNTICNPTDWKEIEIIGWLYQFYIAEKKKKVIGKVVKSEDIPAATQLFTPNWIVKYMVQNSLGAQWMATYPQSPLKGQMEYYIEPAEQTDEVKAQLAAITPSTLDPEELTLIDPASGSGHILVEAYELFKAIYLERGYRQRDVPQLILERNLFGLEICPRAAQLTGFALMMKGRADDRRLFEREVKLNVMALRDSTDFDADVLTEGMELSDYGLKPGDLTELKRLFEHATTFGSLIQVSEGLAEKLPAMKQLSEATSQDLFVSEALKRLGQLVQQAELLAVQYDAVVANPPYMGKKGINVDLKKFLKDIYTDVKSDLFSAFTVQCSIMGSPAARVGIMSPNVWMYISTHEKLRAFISSRRTLASLVELPLFGFKGATVQICTYVFSNVHIPNAKGYFVRLVNFKGGNAEMAAYTKEAIQNRDCGWFFETAQDEFKKIPGSPVAYWVSERARKLFENSPQMREFAAPHQGLASTNNDLFFRLWYEVDQAKSGLALTPKSAEVSGSKWFPIDKGGPFRKWFGNNDFVVNYEYGGKTLCDYIDNTPGVRVKSNGRIINRHKYFCDGVTWTAISSGNLSVRRTGVGHIFSNAGMKVFADSKRKLLWVNGMLNSNVCRYLVSCLSQTLNFDQGIIARLPVVDGEFGEAIVSQLEDISCRDWDSYERSWEFQSLPLLTASTDPAPTIESSYTAWITQNRETIAEMKRLEEENNRLFIDAYGLADELTPDVPIEQITLTMNPAYRYGGKLTEEEQWTRFRQDTMKELISYAVGCMFGRYSLDKPGLILANQGETIVDFNKKVPNATFSPDTDNIIPILDDEYFEDDIVTRFKKFLEVTFSKETLSENLDFIADGLKPKSKKSSEEIIRDYFLKDFFKEHCKMYKKRPIYWLFTSGKKRAFNALIYIHRYDPELLAKMRTDYLHELESKLQARFDMLEGDDVKVSRERQKLRTMIDEIVAYDEILKNMADEFIKIDLDDGVKVNHAKFEGLVAKI